MTLKKLLTTSSILATFAFALANVSTVSADTTCVTNPLYGGGSTQTCNSSFVIVNKTVQDPVSKDFKDNLGSDTPYSATNTVPFQITVTNTGSTNVSSVTVTDDFPAYVVFSSGPGTVSNNGKTLQYVVNNLAAGASNTQTVVGKVVDSTNLPSNMSLLCSDQGVFNTAIVDTADEPEQKDTAAFCIQNPVATSTSTTTSTGTTVLPMSNITTTPGTGPEAFSLLGLIPAALSGVFLRRKSK